MASRRLACCSRSPSLLLSLVSFLTTARSRSTSLSTTVGVLFSPSQIHTYPPVVHLKAIEVSCRTHHPSSPSCLPVRLFLLSLRATPNSTSLLSIPQNS
ncbi:uncharacterized protein BKA78DRAFT_319656 [Phyllosticta capitalensis]|uniref:uncharacterized protein n=1 Tax=Phyllosticta capitalensis TaxID=121624 RepID=UPI00312FC9D1